MDRLRGKNFFYGNEFIIHFVQDITVLSAVKLFFAPSMVNPSS